MANDEYYMKLAIEEAKKLKTWRSSYRRNHS